MKIETYIRYDANWFTVITCAAGLYIQTAVSFRGIKPSISTAYTGVGVKNSSITFVGED